MKLWKRLTAAAVALTMSASAWAMAACGGNNDGNDDNNNSTDQGGNGGITGGSGLTSGEDVSAIVTALKGQELNTVNVKYNVHESESSVHSYNRADGTKIQDEYSRTGARANVMDLKLNVQDGDMDMVIRSNYDYVYDYGDGEIEYAKREDLDYTFVRSFTAFGYGYHDYTDEADEQLALEEITDWSGITLDYGGDITDEIPAYAWGLITSYEPLVNAVILNLASAADAVTLTEGKATVNINKLAHNIVVDLYNALDGYTNDTTIGNILQNGIIAKYLSSIFNIFTIDEVKELLGLYLGDSYEYIAPLFEQVQPDANSNTYDYIVKLVKSAELKGFVNGIIGEEVFESTLDNLTLGFIMQMITAAGGNYEDNGSSDNDSLADSFEPPVDSDSGKVEPRAAQAVADADDGIDYLMSLRAQLGKLVNKITATELTIESDAPDYGTGYTGELSTVITYKNFKMEYTLNADNTIASQKLSFNATQTSNTLYNFYYGDSDDMEFEVRSESLEVACDMSVEYTSSKATLADISNCMVERSEYKVPDGTYTADTNGVWVNYNGYDTYVILTGSITVEDGNIVGISVEDEEGNVLTREPYAPFYMEVTFEYWENDQWEQFTETIEFEANMYTTWSDDTLVNVRLEVRANGGSHYTLVSVYADRVFVTNTVGGVLSGTPWTPIAR